MADHPPVLKVGRTFDGTSRRPSNGPFTIAPIPSISITGDADASSRKRYSYAAQVSPPGTDTIDPIESFQSFQNRLNPVSFEQDTAYRSARVGGAYLGGVQPAPKPSRTQSFLKRINSIRTTFSSLGRYTEIEEDETGSKSTRARGQRDGSDGQEEERFDAGEMQEPIALRSMGSQKKQESERRFLGYDLSRQDSDAFDEQELRSPGVIGDGMNDLLDAPTLVRRGPSVGAAQRKPSRRSPVRGLTLRRHKRQTSDVAEKAQEQAAQTGGIVAVEEIFDISGLDGGAHEALRDPIRDASRDEKGLTKSYYFPPDPDLPDWRPMQMRWPYLTLLVVISLGLAGLQEFLLQLSNKREKNNDGLIKFYQAKEVGLGPYFAWKYMPTIVLVSYGVMWQISDFEIKRLEPYFHLAKPTGATAAESINIDYLTFLQYFVPVKAFRYRHWAVFCSSIATLLATMVIPVLQSAAVNTEPNVDKRMANQPKFVRITAGWSRALSVTLVVVAVCGVLLLVRLERRRSGLQSDPKGIAGLASMATKSHILNDFRNLDVASNARIHSQIRERRYILHKSSLWQGEFIRNPDPVELDGADGGNGGGGNGKGKAEHPLPIMLRLAAGIPYICSLLLFGILIPVFMFVRHANKVTQKAPWLLTTFATVLKLIWSTLEMDLRMVEPFYRLSLRNAPSWILTLDYTGTMPGVICFKAARRGHYLVALVGFCSLLTEVLTVCVSSFSVDGLKFIAGRGGDGDGDTKISYAAGAVGGGGGGKIEMSGDDGNDDHESRRNADETFKSFWISLGLATGILVVLCLTAGLVYARRRHRFVPREPGTIAAVLAFIHQSRMLTDFVGTEHMDGRQMTRYLAKVGKTYGLGWFTGRDGEDHCGVDEEPLKSEYVYGVDWRKGRIRASQIGSWEYY